MMTLTQNAQGQRDWGGTVSLSPSALAVSWFGSSVEEEDDGIAQLRSILSAIRPLSATYRDGITSRFNRDPVDPRFDYQLGFGGRDRYRFVDADTAATLTDRASWRLSAGV